MTEQETVALLVDLLAQRQPFVHVRFGDGDVMFATGVGSVLTGDGEEWSPLLQEQLVYAWCRLAEYPGVLLLGDLETYAVSDGVERQWGSLLAVFRWVRCNRDFTLVHMEALRVGFGYALPFYKAVQKDDRRKVFVGPLRLCPVADLLGCEFLEVPLQVAWTRADTIADIIREEGWELALFAAGRGGKLIQGLLAAESSADLTQVDVGSGLDLLIADGVRRGTDLAVDREAVLAEYREAGLCP